MRTEPVEEVFLRFRRTGEPAAAGAVFDALAPELLLVAARLAPRGVEPEDLVQRTFVDALEHAGRYRAGRPLAAWLVGILVKHALAEGRRARRRVDVARLAQAEPATPADEAQLRELAEAVQGAVRGMPMPYRQVLHLHLLHGLRAHEIADALGRPFRTVQSQLRRGLMLLRRALPAGVATMVAGKAPALAAVRAAVLARVAARAGVVAAAPAPALLRFAMPAVLCVGAVLLGAAAMAGGGAAALPRADAAGHETVGSGTAGATAGEPLLRHALAPAQDPQREATRKVRLRVLRDVDHGPLADALVTAAVKRDGENHHQWRTLPGVHASASGNVELAVPAADDVSVELRVGAPGYVALEHGFRTGPDAEPLDLGDVALCRQVGVAVRVQDDAGVPLSGVRVQIAGMRSGVFAVTNPDSWREPAVTDVEGRTRVMQAPAGKRTVRVESLPPEMCKEEHFSDHEMREGAELEVVVPRPDPGRVITGMLRDARGDPIPGLRFGLRSGDRPGGAATTARDGTFFLHCPEGVDGPLHVSVDTRSHYEVPPDASPLRPGMRDADVRLLGPHRLHLKVLDEATGRPIEAFGVLCFRVDLDLRGSISGDSHLRHDGYHAGGELLVDVRRGDNRLLVLPRAESGYVPSGYLRVEIGEETAMRTVRLHRPLAFDVRVVDSSGTPMPGSHVRLVQKLREDADPTVIHRLRTDFFPSSHWSSYLELAAAETDARGIATLAWQPWSQPSSLRVTGPDHIAEEVAAPEIRPGMPAVTVRVARPARLRGTTRGMEHLPALVVGHDGLRRPASIDQVRPSVLLRNAATGELWKGVDGNGYRIDATGAFFCRDLPPGRWQLLLRYLQPGFSGSTVLTAPQPLAEVVLTTGQTAEAEIDLARLLPATVYGRVYVDGEEVEPVEIGYTAYWPDHRGEPDGFEGIGGARGFAQPDGSYRMTALRPGIYLFTRSLHVPGEPFERELRTLDPVQLRAGEERELDLQFVRRAARVRFVREDGAPLAQRLVEFRSYGSTYRETDDEGCAVLDPIPARALRAYVFAAGLDLAALNRLPPDDPRRHPREVGRLVIDTEQRVTEHTVRVPDSQ